MLYIIICFVLMLNIIKDMWKLMKAHSTGTDSEVKIYRKVFFYSWPLILLVISPFFISVLSANLRYSEEKLATLSLLVQWLGFASAVGLVIIYFYFGRLKTFWNTGCVILSLIMAFIFFDSAMFNSGENGIAPYWFISSMTNDVKCEKNKSGMVLFKYNKNGNSDWRCPTGIALMQESGESFIPWPEYEGGSSSQLTASIKELDKYLKEKE